MIVLILLFFVLQSVSSLNAALSSSIDKNFGSVIGSGKLLHLFAAPNSTQTADNAYSYASEQIENGATVYKINPGIKKDARLNPPASGNSALTIHPLYDKSVSCTTLMGGTPAIVITEDVGLGAGRTVALLSSNELVYTNTEALKDASGSDSSAGVVALAASTSHIFAAVKAFGGLFGSLNSGIALLTLEQGKGGLTISNPQTGIIGVNKAYGISFSADTLLAITSQADIGEDVTLHWDATLQRLFVGMRLTKSSSLTNGGVVSLLVGRIDDSNTAAPNTLVLEPAVPLNSASFVSGNLNHGFGFFIPTGSNSYATIHKIATLHTSTGRPYVICNGGVSSTNPSDVRNKVFAMPLVRYRSGTSTAGSSIGKIAKKTSPDSQVESSADLVFATEAAGLVGAGNLPSDSTQLVKDMQAVGDTVFVALENSASIEKSGIFASSAIFDANGSIARWTPWQRVMGSTDRVFGMGVDTSNGTFGYLSNNTANANIGTVKATQWGEGAKDGLLGGTTSFAEVGLLKLIESEFLLANGGVQGLFDFDNQTASFKAVGSSGNLGMMVITGYKKVVLVETGSKNGTDPFTPNSGDFTANLLRSTNGISPTGVAGTKVIAFSGGVLESLGPISTADVSRVALNGSDEKGYLFVGGPQGVAVLSKESGAGWSTAAGAGLQRGFVPLDASFAFRLIKNISGVIKVVCDDTNLYVLTRSQLLRLSLSTASNFDGVSSPTVTILATASSLTGNARGAFKDFVVSGNLGLLATNFGVFRSGNGGNVASSSSISWVEVKVSDGTNLMSVGPVLRLECVSATKGGFYQGGNVYLLQTDLNYGLSLLYRLEIKNAQGGVDSTTVSFIKQSPDQGTNDINYVGFGDIRLNAVSDAGFLSHNRSKHFSDIDALRIIEQIQNVNIYVGRGGQVSGLNLPSGALLACGLRRNTSSGALILPGQWGIRLNE